MAGEKVSSVLLITDENVTFGRFAVRLKRFTRLYARTYIRARFTIVSFFLGYERLPTPKLCHYHFNATGLIIHSLTVRRWQRNQPGPRFPRSKGGYTIGISGEIFTKEARQRCCHVISFEIANMMNVLWPTGDRFIIHRYTHSWNLWIIGLIFPRGIFIFRCTYRRIETRKRRGCFLHSYVASSTIAIRGMTERMENLTCRSETTERYKFRVSLTQRHGSSATEATWSVRVGLGTKLQFTSIYLL